MTKWQIALRLRSAFVRSGGCLIIRAIMKRRWARLRPLHPKSAVFPWTLREWVKQAAKDNDTRDGVTTEERDRIKAPEKTVPDIGLAV
jgi:hypothetical protein